MPLFLRRPEPPVKSAELEICHPIKRSNANVQSTRNRRDPFVDLAMQKCSSKYLRGRELSRVHSMPCRLEMGWERTRGKGAGKRQSIQRRKKFKKRLKNCLLSSAYIWHWKRRRAAPSPPSRGLSLPENCPASASASVASDNRLVGRNSEDEIPRLVHPIFRVRFRST